MLYVSTSPLPYLSLYGEQVLSIEAFHQPKSKEEMISLLLLPPHMKLEDGVLDIQPRRLLISWIGYIPDRHEDRNTYIVHTDASSIKTLRRTNEHGVPLSVGEDYIKNILEPYNFIFEPNAFQLFWRTYNQYPRMLLINLQDLINVFRLEGRRICIEDIEVEDSKLSSSNLWRDVMLDSNFSRRLLKHNPTLLMEVRRDVELNRLDIRAAFHILNHCER